MLGDLRTQANAEAQKALRAMNDYMSKHGERNAALDDAYSAAERVVDAIEELEKHLAVALQVADDEAPDLTLAALLAENAGYVSEIELRAIWGDR